MDPLLLAGGTGLVGRWAARHLRAAHPDVPLLVGGRDVDKAGRLADEIGHAEPVRLDLADPDPDLGLGDRPVSAVATLFRDDALRLLELAQDRGVGHISISAGVHEIAPEAAAYTAQPDRSAVVLGAEWLVGATTIPVLVLARELRRVQRIHVAVVLDEQDVGGPDQVADLERLTGTTPLALERRDRTYDWRDEDETSTIRAVDGTPMAATPLSPYDVVALGATTRAADVRLDLAEGVTSTRREGGPMSTEIIVDVVGEDLGGRPVAVRQAVVHPLGQMSPTGLGVAMVLERLAGLDGRAPTPPGLYFPSQVIDHDAYLERLTASGGELRRWDLPPSDLPG